MEDSVREEINRIVEILRSYNIKQSRIEFLTPVVENTAWMKCKLDDTREKIKTSSVVVPYDNGGGQKGIRENPLFKGYESLWKSYMTGMSQIFSVLPQEKIEEITKVEKPKTMLELVRNKHKKEA